MRIRRALCQVGLINIFGSWMFLKVLLSISLAGQIISTVKESCRKAFQNQPQRLVTPMYACNIVCSADVLGKFVSFICQIEQFSFVV